MDEEGQDQDEEKSEEPTHKRLEKAKEKGQVPFSKELITLSVLVGSFFCILYIIPFSSKNLVSRILPFIDRPHSFEVDGIFVAHLFKDASYSGFMFLLPTFLTILLLIISTGLYQKWGALSFKALTPKLSNLSIKKGLKKIFSMQNVVETIKNVIKITCLLFAIYLAVKNRSRDFHSFQWLTIVNFFKTLLDFNMLIFLSILITFAAIASFDIIYQRFQFHKKMKMSKYDIKQEYKEAEGNQEVKSKLKGLRLSRAHQRMMERVPTATVVLANPTHYAIALFWDEEKVNAPIVVAKGQDFMAQRIKEIAKNNNVPVIENPSLTRALYEVVDIEDEIPPKFYKAVADVIRIVMRLKNKYF